jgi:hypothetical protein
VKDRVDRQLKALAERIYLDLEAKGVVPNYGRWSKRG